ncbi:MAG TPA: OST-HTH/LOTUS domain-containing protein [Burkholderiaceae bacterium]|nr:OST-HTH/LOTUS domain-containing protein [Burkholderiaceae bacterium]
MTTLPTAGALQALQHEVQRLLGRCLLRLQQYEHLIKAIVAHHEIAGPAHALESIRAARVADTASKTLGTLVGSLLGSYVVTDEVGAPVEVTANAPENVISFGMRMHLSLSAEDYSRTQDDLKELVSLRNNLVHHFIDHHDLWSLDGCRGAQDALVAAHSRIDQHFEQLRGWAEHMDQARRLTAEFVQSDAFHDLVVNGIAPDGVVDWPAAGIVRALREAASELAVDGWAPVALAGRWIAEQHPDQLPAKYGCSSWRQVVHESRLFELRYREVDGQRAAWYRAKQDSAHSR